MTTATASEPRVRAMATRAAVIDWLSRYAATSTTMAVLLLAVILTPSFYSAGNLRTVLLQASVLGVVVLGQTVALLVRGIDMSVSAVVAVSAVLVVPATSGRQILIAVLLAAGIGVLVGLVNGLLITQRNVPPFVATFAVLIVVSGGRLAYTHGQTSGSVPGWLRNLGSGSLVGLPIPLLIWVVMGLLLFVALNWTTWGRWVYSVGASPEAARHGGVPTAVVTVSAFVVCSLCAMIAGLLFSGYLGYVDQNIGVNLNLNSIAAAIIGGVAFSGGRGGVFGAAMGAVLITVLVNVVVVAGLPIYWQFIAQGAVLVFAVTVQGLRDRWVPE